MKPTSRLLSLVAGMSAVLTLSGCQLIGVQADYLWYSTVEDLAENSTVVVEVTIGSSQFDVLYPQEIESDDPYLNPNAGATEPQAKDSGVEITVFTVIVDEAYRGEFEAGDTISVQQLGGETTREIDGFPLKEGERYLLFLQTYPYENHPASIVGGSQGQFLASPDGTFDAVDPANELRVTRETLDALVG